MSSFPLCVSHQIVAQIHDPYISLYLEQTDGADEFSAHRIVVKAKHMFDAHFDLRPLMVDGILVLRKRLIPFSLMENLTAILGFLQGSLGLIGSACTIGPDRCTRIFRVKQHIEYLTIMNRRFGNLVMAYQFVLVVYVDMVLVTIVALAMFPGPARLDILLRSLMRLAIPFRRHFATLYLCVLFACVALFRHRHDRCVDALSSPGPITLPVQVAIKPAEERFDHTMVYQRLPKQPDRRGLRHSVLDAKAEKTLARETVFYLVVGLLVAEIVQTLRHQDLEYQDRVIGPAPGTALAIFFLLFFQYRAESSPVGRVIQHFQWVTFSTQCRMAFFKVKKSRLFHTHSWFGSPKNSVGILFDMNVTKNELFFEVPLSKYHWP